jgi:alpha-L-fucosidase
MSASSLTEAQSNWMKLGYGMFIHFGPNTLTKAGWGDGKFQPRDVHFPHLDIRQWAQVAAEAGMKYAVLTTKHHDGFCLWPSKHTEYCIKNATTRIDIVGAYADEFRKAGLQVGLYYSLWDRNYPEYENDKKYAEYMRQQITELLTHYGPIVELWFDGAWDKDFPSRQWPYDPAWERDPKSGLMHGQRWEWKELYQHIHRLQPQCLVVNNSSSDRPGQVRYPPVDLRTVEHFDFIFQEKLWEPRLDPNFENDASKRVQLPLEYCTSLNPDWFWIEGKCYSHPSVETIAGWHRRARSHSANLLLNVGPDKSSAIPEYHARFLKAAAREI